MERLINKKILVITSILYTLIVVTYELFYCNFELFHNTNSTYNFSLFRIVFYVAIYVVFFIFKEKFIEATIKSFNLQLKRILLYFFSFAIFAILLIIIGLIIIYKTYYLWQIITIVSLLLFELVIIYITNDIIKNSIIICLTMGIVFSISITINNQLDEKKHFLSAYSLSLGNISRTNHTVDISLTEIEQKITVEEFNKYFGKKPKNILTNNYNSNDLCETPATYYPISYITDATGIFLARILGGSVADIYFAGRVFNLFGYCLLICITLKILPYKKKSFFVVFFMPMLLCLSAVHSPDGITMGLVSLFIAYCLKLYKQYDNISIKQLWILILIFILMITSKSIGYIFVSIVMLILPLAKIVKENKKYMWYIILLIIIILTLLIVSTYSSEIHDYGDSRSERTNSLEQLKFVINNPIEYAKILFTHTIRTFGSIKCLSYLNAPMFFGRTYYNMFIVILWTILFVGITDGSKSFNIKTRIIFMLAFLAVFATTSTALYIAYTAVGVRYINGYQCRYIFPIITLLLMSISNKKLDFNKEKNVDIYITYIISISILISIIGVIFC